MRRPHRLSVATARELRRARGLRCDRGRQRRWHRQCEPGAARTLMPSKLAIALVVAIFLITVLVRMSAGGLPGFFPHDVDCPEQSGTLWQGACAEMRSGQIALSDLHWTLHPRALLRARLRLELQS